MKKKLLLLIPIIIIASFSIRFIILAKRSQKMTVRLGVTEDSLTPCQSESNCFAGEVQVEGEDIWINLKETLKKQGMNREAGDEQYIYYTDKSSLFHFVDDVEFLYSPSHKTLHFRSSSRVGKSDLGANKERILKLLQALKIPFKENSL